MTTLTAPVKEIKYNHGDYDMYLDGQYVGSAACYHIAEVELDRLAYERLDRAGVEPELLLTATALDGGSSVEEIAAALEPFPQTYTVREWSAGGCRIVRSGLNADAAFDLLCRVSADIYDSGENAFAEKVLTCATCGSNGSPCVDCNPFPDDPGHDITLPDPAECPDISAPRPVEDLPAATYPAWLLGLPDVAPAALPDPCFILPDGAATQSIILCIGGVSRVVSAQGVAEALALASVHQITQ